MFFRSQKKGGGELSLSEQLEADGDGDGLSLLDTLADETDMAEEIGTSELCRQMLRCVDTVLDTREAEIIRMRYGLSGEKQALTQREVAERTGISRSYVSRIEKRALAKLRRALDG